MTMSHQAEVFGGVVDDIRGFLDGKPVRVMKS